MQQEAVTLLESADADGEKAILLEGEDEAGTNEASEAEQAARALLGLPDTNAGMLDSFCARSAIPATARKLPSTMGAVISSLAYPFFLSLQCLHATVKPMKAPQLMSTCTHIHSTAKRIVAASIRFQGCCKQLAMSAYSHKGCLLGLCIHNSP